MACLSRVTGLARSGCSASAGPRRASCASPRRRRSVVLDLAGDDRLGGSEDHRHVAPVEVGPLLDDRQLGELLGQAVEERDAALGVGDLAAAEHDRDLDLVLGLEEALDVALLGGVVVRGDLRPELDLPDVDLLLVLLGLLDFWACSYLYFE